MHPQQFSYWQQNKRWPKINFKIIVWNRGFTGFSCFLTQIRSHWISRSTPGRQLLFAVRLIQNVQSRYLFTSVQTAHRFGEWRTYLANLAQIYLVMKGCQIEHLLMKLNGEFFAKRRAPASFCLAHKVWWNRPLVIFTNMANIVKAVYSI